MIPEKGKSPLVLPKDAPSLCSFCGQTLNGSVFTAFTRQDFDKAAICSSCIKKFGRMARLMEKVAIYGNTTPDYLPLRLELLSAMVSLKGSTEIKQKVVSLCLRVLQRTSAVLYGEVSAECPKTGVSLLKPRPLVLISPEFALCDPLFRVACEEIGIFYVLASRDELLDGRAFEALTVQANDETTWAEHGIIYCPGSYCRPLALSTVVFGSCSDSEFPIHLERL